MTEQGLWAEMVVLKKKKRGVLNVYLLLTRRTYLVYRDYQNCEERQKS